MPDGRLPGIVVNYCLFATLAREFSLLGPGKGGGGRLSIFFLDPDLTPNEVLQGLKEAFPLEIKEQSTEHLTYFDTFDWRLSKAGLTFAASPADSGFRLTLLTGDGRILKTRARRIPNFAADLPVGPFRDALQPAARIRRMLPKAQAVWNGELFSVLNEDEKTVVRLFVLEGEASLPTNGAREPVPPRIRLLPLKGYEEDLRQGKLIPQEELPPPGRGEGRVFRGPPSPGSTSQGPLTSW